MSKFCAVLFVFVAAIALCAADTDGGIVEPTLRMVDRSPSPMRGRMPPSPHAGGAPTHGMPARGGVPSRGGMAARGQPSAGGVDTDEAISFSVNTRGEFGNTRAPLFCNCQVLAVLVDDEVAQRNEFGEVVGRRSYTAPELRAHVPLVTPEYAKLNDQISFGVNIRGEEGPELNPTWCTCQILAHEQPANNAEGEDDDDEEGEAKPPMHRPGPQGIARPHVHLELDEGSTVAKEPTAAEIAESTTNIQLQEGVDTPATNTEDLAAAAPQQEVASKSEDSQVTYSLRPTAHRHSWRTGVDMLQLDAGSEAQATISEATGIETASVDAQQKSVDSDFFFHGHHYTADGKLLDSVETATETPAAETASVADQVATQILAQLDEGSQPAANTTTEPVVEEKPVDTVNATQVEVDVSANVTAPTNASVVVPEQSNAENTTVIPTPIATPIATPSPSASEDSEDEDALTALQHLARSHPHASAILSRALQMAASEQQTTVAKLKNELAAKDKLLNVLASEKTKAEDNLRTEMEIVQKMQTLMLRTPSPSPSPSTSPSPSPIPSPSPTPSPSASVAHRHHRHHHHGPRVNKNACYHTCRTNECAPLFEQSLRHYASCMDQCASKCYGA